MAAPLLVAIQAKKAEAPGMSGAGVARAGLRDVVADSVRAGEA